MRNDIPKYLSQYKDIYGSSLFIDNSLNINRYYDNISSGTSCYISKSRKKSVIEEGDINAKIVLIGESIAQEENFLVEQFGQSNRQLLENILSAINLKFTQIYLMNIIKSSSLDGKSLFLKDIECENYISSRIDLIQPHLVISLGLVPMFAKFNKTNNIDTLRNKIHKYENSDLIFTYHPERLIFNKHLKVNAWNDFKLIKNNYIDEK
tara:strand:+ start:192 stop:815 length:624 start_codon:yes stop_codon:yes gene_type:complete